MSRQRPFSRHWRRRPPPSRCWSTPLTRPRSRRVAAKRASVEAEAAAHGFCAAAAPRPHAPPFALQPSATPLTETSRCGRGMLNEQRLSQKVDAAGGAIEVEGAVQVCRAEQSWPDALSRTLASDVSAVAAGFISAAALCCGNWHASMHAARSLRDSSYAWAE